MLNINDKKKITPEINIDVIKKIFSKKNSKNLRKKQILLYGKIN